MKDRYSVDAQVYKRAVVRDAIRNTAPNCKGNFEIPMSAINYINFGNRLRKKPIRASYQYVQDEVYKMLRDGEI